MRGSTLASGSAERAAPLGLARRFLQTPAGVVGLSFTGVLAVVAVFADRLAPGSPFHAAAGQRLLPPSWAHPMGTDNIGRDIYSGVVHGARHSMTVVVWVVVLSSVIGLALGAIAGYRGGLVDDAVMRVGEVIQSVPRFFVAILAAGWFGPGRTVLVTVLALTSWPLLARVVRAQTLSIRELAYVDAARAVGATAPRIVVRHVLPNVLPASVVVIALTGSRVILLEASLAFLGLGNPEAVSWGSLVHNAQGFLELAWWMSVFPGAAIVIAVLGFNLMADALNDVLDPAARPDGPYRPGRDIAAPEPSPAPVSSL